MRLQSFEHDRSPYERPNEKWVCGHRAEGRPFFDDTETTAIYTLGSPTSTRPTRCSTTARVTPQRS